MKLIHFLEKSDYSGLIGKQHAENTSYFYEGKKNSWLTS